jgi:hypothetical protein
MSCRGDRPLHILACRDPLLRGVSRSDGVCNERQN